MRKKTLTLSAAVLLSAGILFSITAGVSYASETDKTEPYGDHQELQIPIYEESVDVWSECLEPANQKELTDALKDPDVTAILIPAEEITAAVSIKRPVHFEVVGYDELSASQKKDLKIKVDLSEQDRGSMIIRGLPKDKVDLVHQGSTVIYWGEQSIPSIEPELEEIGEESVSSEANEA